MLIDVVSSAERQEHPERSIAKMSVRRPLVIGSAFLLVLGACTSSGDLSVPTTSTQAVTTSTSEASATTTSPPRTIATIPQITRDLNDDILGVLPDGTPYIVIVEDGVDHVVEGVSAAIIVDLGDDQSRVLGITTFSPSVAGDRSEDSSEVRSAGGWTVNLGVYSEVKALLGEEADELLLSNITMTSLRGLPVLELEAPFRWASDDEIPLAMGVVYTTFVVWRGCADSAAACSETNAVQVVPASEVVSGQAEWTDPPAWIFSQSPRPPTDSAYFEPGPLAPRGEHDVLWTGDEMIVWGGALSDRPPHLVDGAAFDPDTSTWRELSPSPLEPQVTRAVWAGDRMIVVGFHGTMAFDPQTDVWTEIGDGAGLPLSPSLIAWTGTHVATWGPAGIQLLDPSVGVWEALPDPGFGSGERWRGALLANEGSLIVAGLVAGVCEGRGIAIWTGEEWDELPMTSLATGDYADCTFANQTAVFGDEVVIWDDETHPTMAYNIASGEWSEIHRITLSGSEGAQGSVPLGEMLMVPQWGAGALLRSTDAEWMTVDLPGSGEDRHMVWTGTELLMWGATCCYGSGDAAFRIDAWRWTPPVAVLGPDSS